jgi:ATP-dependent RNA helicase DDX21
MLQARSLLTAHEDFTTLQFHAGTEIQRPGFVFSALKQRLPEAKVEEIKRICLTVDQKSAIFDVPSQYVKVCASL